VSIKSVNALNYHTNGMDGRKRRLPPAREIRAAS